MRGKEFIDESSGYTLAGSYTDDLVISKLWLAHELKKILQDKPVPVAYVLGSWYGNMSTILRKMQVPIDTIIDVEKNKQWLATGRRLQQGMGIKGVEPLAQDANTVDYQQTPRPQVVINTSTNDMSDHGWFDHVPKGTIVALQGRDHAGPEAQHVYSSPEDLLELYPLETVLYRGTKTLKDPETQYQRHMVIGIKGTNQLRELTFMGLSQCTKDCSGHRAGYAWSRSRGGATAASWSPSFNRGAEIASQGY